MHAARNTKGRLVSIRHNDMRYLIANILKEVCNDVEVEAILISLTGEQVEYRSPITGDEAKRNFCARSFWVRDQEAF